MENAITKLVVFYYVVNETLFNCATKCTKECLSSHFSGSISFAQLSSQAINYLINTKGDEILKDYLSAQELLHRIDGDVTLTDNLQRLNEQTKYLLFQINSISVAAKLINKGFSKFMSQFVLDDVNKVRNTLLNFSSVYNNFYKSNRQLAAEYVVQVTKNLLDLSNEIHRAPMFFSSFYDAQWFYTSLASLIDKCVVSTRLAGTYLLQVLKDEANINLENSPDRFYYSDLSAQVCYHRYSITSQSLETIASFLSYASQKILRWIEKNSQNIINSTSEKLLEALITKSNNNNNNNNNKHDITGNFSGVTREDLPNLWELLECAECNVTVSMLNYSTWFRLVENLTMSSSEAISNCLFEYERTLEMAYNTTIQLLKVAPSWKLEDTLSNYTHDFAFDMQSLSSCLHSLITGTSTLQETIANVADITQSMNNNIVYIEDKIASVTEQWLNDVNNWHNDVNVLYTLIASNAFSLLQYMSDNTNITTCIMSLYIWYLDTIYLDIVYYYRLPLTYQSDFIYYMFYLNLTNFLQFEAANVTQDTLSTVFKTNIKHAKQLSHTIQSLTIDWSEQAKQIIKLCNQYKGDFIVHDAFIR